MQAKPPTAFEEVVRRGIVVNKGDKIIRMREDVHGIVCIFQRGGREVNIQQATECMAQNRIRSSSYWVEILKNLPDNFGEG